MRVSKNAMVFALTSTTMNTDAYAVVFGQCGLMAGVGIEGSKISLIGR